MVPWTCEQACRAVGLSKISVIQSALAWGILPPSRTGTPAETPELLNCFLFRADESDVAREV